MKNKIVAGLIGSVTALFLGATAAYATTPPTAGEVVGDVADDGIAQVFSIFSTNAGKLVGLAALAFGISWVFRAVRSGGKKAS